MQNITIANKTVNVAALSEQLSNLSSTEIVGMSVVDDDLILHFSGEATEQFIEQVQALVAAHNPTILTPVQEEALVRQERLEQLREQNRSLLNLADYAQVGSEMLRLAEKIAWLELEITKRD